MQTKLLFMEIQNIHAVRASADSLQALCEDPSDQKWLSRLEATGWLNHVQSIMSAACSLARKMDHQRLSCVVSASFFFLWIARELRVQSHPDGGQFDFVWHPACTMHPHAGPQYVWRA